ncbi:hypothetical protein ACVWYH_003638 [Bradyrhizobium sp. GM24.11]
MNYKKRQAVFETIEGLRAKASEVARDGHMSAERHMLNAADMLATEAAWHVQAWRGASAVTTVVVILFWLARHI